MRLLHWRILFSLLLAAFITVTITGQGMANCKFNVGFSEVEPFHSRNVDGEIRGIDADILQSVVSEMGCDLNFKEEPWKRVLSNIKLGFTDLGIGASFKTERAKFAHYSYPYRAQPHVILTSHSFSDVEGLKQFLDQGHSLGVVLGWHYTNPIRAILDSGDYPSQIIIFTDLENLASAFLNNRTHGILANPSALAGVIGDEAVKEDYHMIRADVDILHFLLSKASVTEEQAKEFNAILHRKFEAGFFMDTCSKYEDKLVSNCDLLELD